MARARELRSAPPFEVIEVLSRAEAAGRHGRRRPGGRCATRCSTARPGTAEVSRKLAERFGPPPTPPRPDAGGAAGPASPALARRLAEACEEERGGPRGPAPGGAADLADALDRLAGGLTEPRPDARGAASAAGLGFPGGGVPWGGPVSGVASPRRGHD